MYTKQLITLDQVKHVIKLAKLDIDASRFKDFQKKLESIMEYVKLVQEAPTDGVVETAQTTGLTNVWREDVVDDTRTFTQEQALSNAKKTYEGYIVVPAVFEEQDA